MKPTKRQIEQWEQFKREARASNHLAYAIMLSDELAMIAADFAKERGLAPLDPLALAQLQKRAKQITDIDAKAQRIVAAVELEKLGLRFTPGNSDFDILAPIEMSADERAQYQVSALGYWQVVVVGVVVVAAAAAWIAWVRRSEAQCIADYNDLLDERDKDFCKDTSSPTCAAWLQRKEEKGYEQKQGTIETLKEQAAKLGQVIKKGAQWGLALAIPLVLWAILSRR